jgi:hypothetical protein
MGKIGNAPVGVIGTSPCWGFMKWITADAHPGGPASLGFLAVFPWRDDYRKNKCEALERDDSSRVAATQAEGSICQLRVLSSDCCSRSVTRHVPSSHFFTTFSLAVTRSICQALCRKLSSKMQYF